MTLSKLLRILEFERLHPFGNEYRKIVGDAKINLCVYDTIDIYFFENKWYLNESSFKKKLINEFKDEIFNYELNKKILFTKKYYNFKGFIFKYKEL